MKKNNSKATVNGTMSKYQSASKLYSASFMTESDDEDFSVPEERNHKNEIIHL